MKRILIPAALLILAMFGAFQGERIVIAPDDVWQPVYRLDPAPVAPPISDLYTAISGPIPAARIENSCTTVAIGKGTAQCR